MIITKRHIGILAGLLAALVVSACIYKSCEVWETAAGRDFTVIIDSGHGYPDGGAVGVSGTEEKDINLAISVKLREILESRGITVIMTREDESGLQSGDASTIREMKVSDMNKRRDIMENSDADLFLSIHMNSFSDSSVSGLHIFYDKSHPEGEELAKRIQEKIGGVTGAKTHTVKTADDSLFLMKNAPIPAILAECGFLSNPAEEERLKTEEYQAKIAWAIAEALFDYTN